MTNIADLYPFLRCLLGDRYIMSRWHYDTDDLLSAVRTVFALGRNPQGYALAGGSNGVYDATSITPDLATGDPFAELAYEAVLVLIGGEDGKKEVRTREITVKDGGDRKRDLMGEMKLQLYRIRDGACVFSSRQSLTEFLCTTGGGLDWRDYTGFSLVSTPADITV